MIPSYYACGSCQKKFTFAFREAWYHVSTATGGTQVAVDDLLPVNLRPGWCKDCEAVCAVEDIEPLRVFEDAYGAIRSGRSVDYPVRSEYMEAQVAMQQARDYLRWRMGRVRPARALCCGGSRYQLMDVAQPILKHEGCEYGFIGPLFQISGQNGPEPGIGYAANIRLYDAEGVLIGKVTWRKDDVRMWDIEPLAYPLAGEE